MVPEFLSSQQPTQFIYHFLGDRSDRYRQHRQPCNISDLAIYLTFAKAGLLILKTQLFIEEY